MQTFAARFFLTILCAAPCLIHAQTSKVFKVKAGEYPDKVIPYADRYRFSQFTQGKAEFMDGRSSAARFNYNYVGGHVLFVDVKRDTLEIIDKELLKSVTIGDKNYRFNKRFGYCEIVGVYNKASLGKREILARIDTEKGGPYGISYTASSVTTYRSYSSDRATTSNRLNANAEGVFTYRTGYFLIDDNNRFYIPSAATVKKLYPFFKTQIGQYLKEQPVDFGKEADLKRLLAYCGSLSE